MKKLNAPGNEPGNEPGLEIDPEVFQKLLASDGSLYDWFGDSVAASADGSTVVKGTQLDDDKAREAGAAYVFTKQANGSYEQTQKLLATDRSTGYYFGSSVAISADESIVAVGAREKYSGGGEYGSVYIFTKQANGSYLETQKLVATDGAAYDWFGWSVAVSGDGSTVVVGAYEDDDKGSVSGSAYIFTKQVNGSYVQTQKLTSGDGAANDQFGRSVAVTGDGSTVVVGTPWIGAKDTDFGSVYVFTKQADGSYLQPQKLVAVDGASGDNFGDSLAVSADGLIIVIGASCSGGKGIDSGSVYIFTKQANGSYLETHKLVATDGAASDQFGWSVAVSADGTTVVIGAFRDDDKGSDSGSVYIFTKQADGSYLEIQKLVAADGAVGDNFGYNVAVSNTSVVIGAYNYLDKGAVYVY